MDKPNKYVVERDGSRSIGDVEHKSIKFMLDGTTEFMRAEPGRVTIRGEVIEDNHKVYEGLADWLHMVRHEAGSARTIADRQTRQVRAFDWARSTFGEAASKPPERALRLLEEVVELAQAEGISRERAVAVVDHVFGKPVGEPAQEVGGVGLTLLLYCESRRFSADTLEELELRRVLDIDPGYFRERHNRKADAGIAARAPEPDPEERK